MKGAAMAKPKQTQAARTRDLWARQVAQSLRDKGVDLERASVEINRRIDAAVAARAYHESADHPKIQLDFEYPMRLFLEPTGGARGDVFEAGLPASIRISKLYVPFGDGSVLLVQTPNQDAVMAAQYISMFIESKPLRELMDVDSRRLAPLRQIVAAGQISARVGALDPEEVQQMLQAEASAGGKGLEGPLVRINLAAKSATVNQAVGALMEFFDHPTDTISASTSQWLAREFGARA
jgi:hypothetical protein